MSRDKNLNKLISLIGSSDVDPEETNDDLILDRKDLYRFKSSDSSIPWLYGLIKIHKPDQPLREISSAVDLPGHELMKKVSQLLQPLVGKEKTFVKDGYHFVDMLKSRFYMHKRGFQVSLDVTALFPSLPMEEALGILERRLSEDENLSKRTNLSVGELMLLIRECVQSPYFECELGRFRQEAGALMGGPPSCVLSDLFLEEYEKKIRFEINDKVIGADWLRFRDDTWLIWEHSLEDLHAFVSYLNFGTS